MNEIPNLERQGEKNWRKRKDKEVGINKIGSWKLVKLIKKSKC